MSLRDIFLALFTIAIWGGNFVAIKIGVTELPPIVMLTLRFALTTIVFLPFIRWPGKQKFWLLVEISIYMSVIHQGLLFLALNKLDASTMSVVLQSQILFATVLGWLILKESIGWKTATGLGIGFIGILMTLGSPDIGRHPGAFALSLLSALSLAFSYIRLRQLKDIHPATFIALTNGIAVPFVLFFSFVVSPDGWQKLDDANWVHVGEVLAYQVLLVSLSHIVWQMLLSRNKVASVASFILLMPIVAVIMSFAILGETIDMSLVWGGVLTLLGVAIITIRKGQKKVPIEADPVT